ncbi:hypothetical protein [Streptomyces griseorubiginosus]
MGTLTLKLTLKLLGMRTGTDARGVDFVHGNPQGISDIQKV